MDDNDAKDIANAIEKIIDRKRIHISVDQAKQIVATIKMMEAVGYLMDTELPGIFANPATATIFTPYGKGGLYEVKTGINTKA